MRNRFFLAVLVILAALPGNLAWGQASLPNNPNAVTIQGPDPTGQQGYPLATVPATGALPWPVAIQSFAASVCVTQCTSPWITDAAIKINPDGSTSDIPLPAVTAFGVLRNGPNRGDAYYPMISAAGAQGSSGSGIVAADSMVLDLASGTFVNAESGYTDGYLANHVPVSFPTLITGTGNLQTVRQRTPAVFKTVATAAAGNTALWTPAAGKSFRLMRWRFSVAGSATTAGGADVLVKLFDGAAGPTGQQDTVTVPAAATTLQGQLAASPWIDLGNGYLSTAANNVLNINLSAALSAGTVTVEAVGTEE